MLSFLSYLIHPYKRSIDLRIVGGRGATDTVVSQTSKQCLTSPKKWNLLGRWVYLHPWMGQSGWKQFLWVIIHCYYCKYPQDRTNFGKIRIIEGGVPLTLQICIPNLLLVTSWSVILSIMYFHYFCPRNPQHEIVFPELIWHFLQSWSWIRGRLHDSRCVAGEGKQAGMINGDRTARRQNFSQSWSKQWTNSGHLFFSVNYIGFLHNFRF